ncbi:MAG: hypothetical protein IJH41_02275 [Eubacterium sp.]|nr:hypothetical protein [Eubacterium sp.]
MMDKKTRPKMPPSQRAKQFLPFDAVSGLREALTEKEREVELFYRTAFTEKTEEDKEQEYLSDEESI